MLNPSHSMNTPASPPAWAQGGASRIERFILGPELGRGGMGLVQQAWDPMLRRLVAIKILEGGDPVQMMQFLQEAQAQARVDHPNICPIYEVGTSVENSFIVMQYIGGRTLGHLAPSLTPREVAQLLCDVAGAVHAAHRMGLVHRDLKPGNILVETQASGALKPYVLDFGLARDLASPDGMLGGALVGTPAFMSPEQARGAHVGPAADVYSLGATLYAALCGTPPQDAVTNPQLSGIESGPYRSLRRQNPGVPRDLEAIVMKCLEVDPERRFASAHALAEDLRRWLAGEPIHARSQGRLQRLRYWVRRHQMLVAVASLGFGLSAGLLGWGIWSQRRADQRSYLTERLVAELRQAETNLRLERMLPEHSIRPAMEALGYSLGSIQSLMKEMGPGAVGPGSYALGRAHAGLGQLEEAEVHYRRAWDAGERSHQAAFGLLECLGQEGLQDLDEALDLSDPEAQARRLEEIRQIRVPDMVRLQGALREPGGGRTALALAYLALLQGDQEAALKRAREARLLRPWLYEAYLLEAKAHQLRTALLVRGSGWSEAARATADAWGEALEQARLVARSDHRILVAQARRMLWLARHIQEGAEARDRALQRAASHVNEARRIHPTGRDTLLVQLALLRAGGLPEQKPRAQRGAMEEMAASFRQGGGSATLEGAWLAFTLARDRMVAGEDARDWQEWGTRNVPARERVLRAAFLLLEAEGRLRRMEDASSLLEDVRGFLQQAGTEGTGTEWVAGPVLLADAWRLNAQYLRLQGQDPSPAAESGLRVIRMHLERDPSDTRARLVLVGLLQEQAWARLMQGANPDAALQEAGRLLDRLAATPRPCLEVALAGCDWARLRLLACAVTGRGMPAALQVWGSKVRMLTELDPEAPASRLALMAWQVQGGDTSRLKGAIEGLVGGPLSLQAELLKLRLDLREGRPGQGGLGADRASCARLAEGRWLLARREQAAGIQPPGPASRQEVALWALWDQTLPPARKKT